MKKHLIEEAKKLPKLAWALAVVVPGGFMVLGCYLTAKTIHTNKKDKNDRSKDRS